MSSPQASSKRTSSAVLEAEGLLQGFSSPEPRRSPRVSSAAVQESRVTHLARVEKEARAKAQRVDSGLEQDTGAGVLSNSGKKAVAKAATKELLQARREKKLAMQEQAAPP